MRPHRPSKSYQATSSLSISFTLHVEHVSFQHIFFVLVLARVALPSAYLFDCRSCSMGRILFLRNEIGRKQTTERNEYEVNLKLLYHMWHGALQPTLRPQPTLHHRHMPWSFLAPPSPLLACSLSVPLKDALPNKPH